MNRQKPLKLKDCLFLLGASFFFFGCIASAHRSAKTIKPGEISIGGSYLLAKNMEESGAEPIHLMALDSRVGIARGFDMGIMHTWDFSNDNDNAFATFWGDFKVQLTNRDNSILKPIFSIGLMKGYVYHEDAETHITTYPFMFGIPLNESFNVTPFFIYRFELISEEFVPKDSEIRHTFALGIEANMREQGPHRLTPKFGFSIGTFNSLAGGEGDNGLILNIGLSVDINPSTSR
jgi:hypothetical protein